MNLQMLALQAFMNSGRSYDETDPVLKNVMFDVDKLSSETIEKIQKLRRMVRNSRKNLYRLSDFKRIHVKDTEAYDEIVDTISRVLFDDMSYDRINTIEQIRWKEYFHGLYDLVVFPYQSDKTHYLQMINDVYRYYGVLKPPETELEPNDPLYIDTKYCEDLFKKLKMEHRKLLIPKLFKRIRSEIEYQVTRRVQHRNMENQLDRLYKVHEDCTRLFIWSQGQGQEQEEGEVI